MRYLCIFWEKLKPRESKCFAQGHQTIWTELRLLPPSLLNRPHCQLFAASKQTRRGQIYGGHLLCQWPSRTLLSAENHREKGSKSQRPEASCSSHLISDLLGSHPSVSQSKLPNLSPSFIWTSEWKHPPSSILPSFPLSPISIIHHVPKSYLFGFLNISQIQLLLPTSLYWAMIISLLNNWSPCLALSYHLLSTPAIQGFFYKCTFLSCHCSV